MASGSKRSGVASVDATLGEDLISIREAARAVGVHHSVLARQVKTGAIRSHAGRVRVCEVLEDRANNIDLTKRHPRQQAADADDPPDAAEREVQVDGRWIPYLAAKALKHALRTRDLATVREIHARHGLD